ncbi:MAG: ATP-dependent DNA helicase [Candidatus Shapirobacteria bacterium]
MDKTNFLNLYNSLNPEQKLAVDTIEGPVMVFAGAGTGKTQTIALRVAKILLETQVDPSSILCLTFTDNAAQNMRSRLLSIIGSTAHSVKIGTFHSLCFSIIKSNPEFFIRFQFDSQPLDKIEQIQIIRHLIDSLPPQSPLKSPVDTYYYQEQIISAISSLKKENISKESLSLLVNQAKNFLDLTFSFYQQLKSITAYPKNYSQITDIFEQIIKIPDLNSAYRVKISAILKDLINPKLMKSAFIAFCDDCQKNYPKQLELVSLYPQYQQELLVRRRFDFDDLILEVINSFSQNPTLLSQYQERYQYILVDEYQDTNSAQNQIIRLLTSHQSQPNIFVVGDDDQSIFRFQGASVENVQRFSQDFSPQNIVLKNNYRSHHSIINASQQLINFNQNRIAKTLVPTRGFDPDPINLFTAGSATEENFWIISTIKDLITSGTLPNQIAILARNNKDFDDLIPVLTQNEIYFQKDFGANIFNTLEINQLIDLFRLVINPDSQDLLGRVLCFDFIGYSNKKVYRIFKNKLLKKTKLFINIKKAHLRLNNFSSQENFNRIIRRFGFVKSVLKKQNLNLLKQLDRLYSEFKNNSDLNFGDIVARLTIFQSENISLVSPPLLSDSSKSIHLLTVHKAKGLEFEHVFLIKTLASHWEESRGRNLLKLPLGIIETGVTEALYDEELEENRRLFYVALTRAKDQIYISSTTKTPDGREQPQSRFLSEIDKSLLDIKSADVKVEELALQNQFTLKPLTSLKPDIAGYLITYFSQKYRFNITHLNSYLKCPLCFFFNTILKIPKAKSKPLSFGTSVHGSLAYLFSVYKNTGQLIDLDQFLAVFQKNLYRENLVKQDYDDLLVTGKLHLTDYYNHYQREFSTNCFSEKDFRSYNIQLKNIPITGKIDKIEILPDSLINLVDFKTGNPDTKSKDLRPDGSYFRQLVFYKLLVDQSKSFKYTHLTGTIDFIQKNSRDQFVRPSFKITPEDELNLTNLIADTYAKITALEFPINPACPDPDHLHSLEGKWFK